MPMAQLGMRWLLSDAVIVSMEFGRDNWLTAWPRAASGLLKFNTGRSQRSPLIEMSWASMLVRALGLVS